MTFNPKSEIKNPKLKDPETLFIGICYLEFTMTQHRCFPAG
jgi:hypothetical protein